MLRNVHFVGQHVYECSHHTVVCWNSVFERRERESAAGSMGVLILGKKCIETILDIHYGYVSKN